MLAIAILQLVAGAIFGKVNSVEADKALQGLARFEPDETVSLGDGTQWNVTRLRQQIERERIIGYVVPVGFGLVLIGLCFWARRSPLPAFITALCLFLMMHAASAIVDPKTIVQGIPVKVLFILAMVAGIKAALAQRDAMIAAQAE